MVAWVGVAQDVHSYARVQCVETTHVQASLYATELVVVGVYKGWTHAQLASQRKGATCQNFFPKTNM
jgi:hypothetical protein